MLIVHIPFFLFFFALTTFARLLSNPVQLEAEYDFIVVGGGTAGNVVASRLSEIPAFTVLLIGGGDEHVIPLNYLTMGQSFDSSFSSSNARNVPRRASLLDPTFLTNASLIRNHTTVPQTALDHRVLPYRRSRVLGSSSAINSMAFTRGSRDDFDRFSKVTGDPGWSWDAMFPFMLKAETFTPPVDHHNTTGQFNPHVHGSSGPLRVTLPRFPSQLDLRLLATTQIDPVNFPFNPDTNSGHTIGISWSQTTSGHGEQSSSATAYLQLAMQRPNLHVLTQTQVTRLINIAELNATVPDLRKVEFAQNSTSPRLTVRASKEVILSAGPISSPQLLLLSGVGDSKQLSTHGIKTIVQSSGVGQNLQDHPLLSNQFFVNSTNTLNSVFRNGTLANNLTTQWTQTRSSPSVDTAGNQFAWLRVNSSVLNGFKDPSAGPTSAHMELLPTDGFAKFLSTPPPTTGSFITIATSVVSPSSRGNVTLASNDPFAFPIIDPAFMTHPLDVAIMVQAVRTSKALLATPPWKGFVDRPFGALATATSDEELAAWVRSGVVTFGHHSCTAKMGTLEDEMAVVDSSLRLKGAKGVRVVDASVFPFIPAAHTEAPVYFIAERAAALIKNAHTDSGASSGGSHR